MLAFVVTVKVALSTLLGRESSPNGMSGSLGGVFVSNGMANVSLEREFVHDDDTDERQARMACRRR